MNWIELVPFGDLTLLYIFDSQVSSVLDPWKRRDRNSQKGRHAEPHSKGSERIIILLEPSQAYKMSSYPVMRTVCEDIQINGHVGSLDTHWGSQWTRALENNMK